MSGCTGRRPSSLKNTKSVSIGALSRCVFQQRASFFVSVISVFQIQLDCHGDMISSGYMYTDSLVIEVAPAVNAALRGCQYSATGLRDRFTAAAESAAEIVQPQVLDVGAWLEQSVENV